MAAPDTVIILENLLARLLARHTRPGEGHVVLSEGEYGDWLRQELERRARPGERSESTFRSLRNSLAHMRLQVASPTELAAPNASASEQQPFERLRNILDSAPTERRVLFVGAAVASTPPAMFITNYDELLGQALSDLKSETVDEAAFGASDAAVAIVEAFVERITGAGEVFEKMDPVEAKRLGEAAANQALASARWSNLVGDRLDTTQVAELLGVTRQALAKRQASGSLLGLPGHGITWYPAWQFDTLAREIRPQVREIIGVFRDHLGDFDPLLLASWAATPQSEDLNGISPAQWLVTGGSIDELRRAASRAASRLAR